MDVNRQPPPLWTNYSLKACLERSEQTEKALMKVYSDQANFKCFDICRQIIIYLAHKFRVCEQSVSHALSLSYMAVALNGSGGHKIFSASCPFNSFWICISVICFSTSVNFHETNHPRLRDMMYLLKIPYSGYAKMFYHRVQLKFLMQTGWSLYFPTAIDFYECLKSRMFKSDPGMADTIMQLVSDHKVHCIISFCCTEWEMLQFSFCSMAVSAIATVIRIKGGEYDPSDGVIETLVALLDPGMDMEEISRCSELMFKRVVTSIPKVK
jgi:hypothetical protein